MMIVKEGIMICRNYTGGNHVFGIYKAFGNRERGYIAFDPEFSDIRKIVKHLNELTSFPEYHHYIKDLNCSLTIF